MHIPDDPLYYEKFYFTPGDLGFKAFEADFGKFGTLVCWDQWYPEGARLTAAQGANVLFYPTAIGWHPDEKAQYGEAQYDAWRTIQRAHAIANGVYVAVPNRVGFETGNIRGNEAPGKGLEFWGGSFIADPFRTDRRAGSARQGSGPDRRGRSAAHRGRPPQLALLARSPRRCLRAHHAAVPGVSLVEMHKDISRKPRRPRLSHACRMGAARGHLDRVAAQSHRLAGQVRDSFRGSTPRSFAISREWNGSTSW